MALLSVGESKRFSASRMAGSGGAAVAGFGGLALAAAQGFQHPGRAAAQEERVVVDVDHPEPRLAPPNGGLRPSAMDSGGHAVADAGSQYGLDQAPVLGGAGGGVRLSPPGVGHGARAAAEP